MKLFKLINSLPIALATLMLASCGNQTVTEKKTDALPYYHEASFTPLWLSADDTGLDTIHTIPPFTLYNQDGDTLTEKTFEGKIYITDFFFTSCPGICPKMTANFAVLQEAFKDDDEVLLLSHSVTPEKDSVSILKKYAEKKGVISGKWHLATGDQQEIYHLGRQEYFVEEDLGIAKSTNQFLHTENFVLIDHHRRIRGIYNGLNATSVQQLIEDIRVLKIAF